MVRTARGELGSAAAMAGLSRFVVPVILIRAFSRHREKFRRKSTVDDILKKFKIGWMWNSPPRARIARLKPAATIARIGAL